MKKMNFKYLMFAAALVVGLAGCKSDEPNGDDGIVPNKNKAYATIKLSAGNMTARANQDPSVQTPDENAIDDATVFIFDAGKTLESVVSFASGSTATSGEVFETTDGTHYFYVAINKPAAFPASIPVGTTMAAFEKMIINIAAVSDITTAGKFYMTNVETPDAEVLADWDGTGSAPASNEISINVGRGMAKVNVEYPSTATQPASGVLSDVKYAVIGNPKQMFTMPVIRKAPLDLIGTLETPFFTDNSTPNTLTMTDYFPVIAPTSVTADLAGLNVVLGPTANDIETKAQSTAKANYTIENSNRVPSFGNSTYVLLQGTFAPNAWVDVDGNSSAATADGTFYRVYYTSGTDKIYSDKFFDDLLTQPQIDAEITAMGLDPLVQVGSVAKYTEGICYYGIWLADQSIATAKAYDRFTVKRNNYYYVYINDVSGPGSNEPGDVIPDPEKPIITNININVSINILNWTPILQETGI